MEYYLITVYYASKTKLPGQPLLHDTFLVKASSLENAKTAAMDKFNSGETAKYADISFMSAVETIIAK